MNNVPNRRYLDGIVIGSMDSRKEWGNSDDDHVVKLLVVFAKEVMEIRGCFDLVAVVEVEVISIEDGNDERFLVPGKEVYRMPFPADVSFRKAALRLIRQYPKYFIN